jgi:hypothetical protein
VGVLKQYRVKEIDDLVEPRAPPTSSNVNTEYSANGNNNIVPTYAARDQLQTIGEPMNVANNYSMWNEFFTAMPEMEGYDQLFAGLDYYCGPT